MFRASRRGQAMNRRFRLRRLRPGRNQRTGGMLPEYYPCGLAHRDRSSTTSPPCTGPSREPPSPPSRLAGGCTSGHGIFGRSNLERASIVTTVSFIAGGILTTQLLYRVVIEGGS
jgi:hypothetical protein